MRVRNVDLDQNIANSRPTTVKMDRSTLGVAKGRRAPPNCHLGKPRMKKLRFWLIIVQIKRCNCRFKYIKLRSFKTSRQQVDFHHVWSCFIN